MRWAEGYCLVTQPEVIDLLRRYEQERKWRRVKGSWRWVKRVVFRQRSFDDLSAIDRLRVRQELDRIDMEKPQQETPNAD